jgi:exosortase H (IPTLxxWG-CTERM-specific)
MGSENRSRARIVREFFSRNRLLIRTIVLFLGLMGLFSLLVEWGPVKSTVIEPLTDFVTLVSSWILAPFGHTQAQGSLLTYRDFTVDIALGCNGDVVHMILLAGILAFPASWRARVWGFVIGMPAVFLINQIRIVVLSLVGYHYPGWFDTTHVFYGQAGVILGTLVVWILWIEKFARPRAA